MINIRKMLDFRIYKSKTVVKNIRIKYRNRRTCVLEPSKSIISLLTLNRTFQQLEQKRERKMKRRERVFQERKGQERILRCSLPILVETRVTRPRHAMHFRETFSFPSAAIREEDGETKPLVSHVSRHFQQEINAPPNEAAPNRALCQSIVVEQWKSLESRRSSFPSPRARLDLAFSSLYRVSLLSFESRGIVLLFV